MLYHHHHHLLHPFAYRNYAPGNHTDHNNQGAMNGLVAGYDTEEESGDEGQAQQQEQPTKPGACVRVAVAAALAVA